MKKYKLINRKTGQETICDKVTIDGFDYYVSDELPKDNEGYWIYIGFNQPLEVVKSNQPQGWFERLWDKANYKTPIATNNQNLDIPKVVDEVEIPDYAPHFKELWLEGYNKAKETHPFSAEDADAYADAVMSGCLLRAKEWKEQQPETVYYE